MAAAASRVLRFGRIAAPDARLWINDTGTYPVLATMAVAVGW
jgi:hypothetical protein